MSRFTSINYNDTYFLQNTNISHLNDIFFDTNGQLIVRSYGEIKDITQQEISLFCLKNGIYSLPTKELIDFLREEIGEENMDKTIEIAAGNGVYSRELGIVGTDSYMQATEEISQLYELSGQPTVKYGEHVEKLDGNDAVKKYKPEIVVAAWCTHKYNAKEHWRGGNALGVNERNLLSKVKKYIHIGNETVHNKKPIMNKSHRKIKEKWILSRSRYSDNNVIYIWD